MTVKFKLDELLGRGVGEFIDPDGTFRKKLEESPEKIVIKFGIDPTRPDIHLGHAVVLRKLRQFQDLGCKVIFLIGDITAQIGDPSGTSKVRPEVNMQEIQKNMQTYLNQADKILLADEKHFSWTMNSDWFVSINDIIAPDHQKYVVDLGNEEFTTPKLPSNNLLAKALHWQMTRRQKGNIKNTSFLNFISVLRKITFAQLVERDLFQERIKKGEPFFMHEMIYPVIQGIDSDVLLQIYGSCDLEVGGTDQTFNMLVGRKVMEAAGRKKSEIQSVLAFKILEGTDGKDKMSKSLDNYIGITESPSEMYGKILSIPDSSIVNYFELCTYTPLEEIEKIKKELKKVSTNPKDIKMKLARQIVSEYHGEKQADEAESDWVKKFENKEIPENIEEIDGSGKPVDILVSAGSADSTSAARRLFDAGAVTDLTEDKKVSAKDEFKKGHVYKIGKHRFVKIK